MAAALKSRQERCQQGRELRARPPREAHAEFHGPRDRDAVAILAESDASRVPELVPERYKRMMVDPFAFLRGAAAVMATGWRPASPSRPRPPPCRTGGRA